MQHRNSSTVKCNWTLLKLEFNVYTKFSVKIISSSEGVYKYTDTSCYKYLEGGGPQGLFISCGPQYWADYRVVVVAFYPFNVYNPFNRSPTTTHLRHPKLFQPLPLSPALLEASKETHPPLAKSELDPHGSHHEGFETEKRGNNPRHV